MIAQVGRLQRFVLLALDGSGPVGKGMVGQRRDRQAAKFLGQDGVFVAGDGPQDRDALILPPYRELPVCKTADGFHTISPEM